MQEEIDYVNHELAFYVGHQFPLLADRIREAGLVSAVMGASEYLYHSRMEGEEVQSARFAQDATMGLAQLRGLLSESTESCWQCKGEQEIVGFESGTGFAGGNIYFTELACGHINADESDDIRAAQ
jgi:hypothetical protein